MGMPMGKIFGILLLARRRMAIFYFWQRWGKNHLFCR
jgi:hypothetical protein